MCGCAHLVMRQEGRTEGCQVARGGKKACVSGNTVQPGRVLIVHLATDTTVAPGAELGGSEGANRRMSEWANSE